MSCRAQDLCQRLAALIVVLALAWASAPAFAQTRGGHGTVLNYAYPEGWDPHAAGTLGALGAISPIYNQLLEFNPLKPAEIIGDLAKSWDVTDGGLTYTFKLHENVKWWDGKDLTANDVVFSLNRMLETGKPRPRVSQIRPMVKSAEVVDPHTVRVRLNAASPAFLTFLASDYMKILPKHVLEAGVDINAWENIVGSGPFKIKAARRGDSITYERNPTYFKKGRPYLETLRVLTIGDKGTIAAAFRAGKIEMTTASFGFDADDAVRLGKDLKGRYTTYWLPPCCIQHFFMNTERGPWKDLRVIKALSLATDRQEIQKALWAGKALWGAPFPVGSWYGHTPQDLAKLPGYRSPKERDIVEAKALLKDVGYDPPAILSKRTVIVPNTLWYPDLAQLWAAQMRRNLGLEVELKLVDTPSAISAFTSGNFDIGVFGYGFAIDDPNDYVSIIYGPGPRNYTRWKNPQFLKMLDDQAREPDREKRKQTLRKMEEFLLATEDPWIEAMWLPLFFFVSDRVRTEAGGFVPPETIQTILKQEHWWLEK
jgi:peptide/nickel transport system substrate-binding protein